MLAAFDARSGALISRFDTSQVPALSSEALCRLQTASSESAEHRVYLEAVKSDSVRFVWRTYQDSLQLVLCSGDIAVSDQYLAASADKMVRMLEMMCGELRSNHTLERDTGLLHTFAATLFSSSPTSLAFTTDTVECCHLVSDQEVITKFTHNFSHIVTSDFVALLHSGLLVCASRDFWTPELALLVPTNTTMFDIPIFLRGQVFRLVGFELIPTVVVCLLANSQLALSKTRDEVVKFWKPCEPTLRKLGDRSIWALADVVPFPEELLICYAIATVTGKSIHYYKGKENAGKYLELVKRFFLHVKFTWQPKSRRFNHRLQECYVCYTNHICFMASDSRFQVFAIYPESTGLAKSKALTRSLHAHLAQSCGLTLGLIESSKNGS